MSCLVTLSQKELHRLEAVQKIRQCRLTVTQAAGHVTRTDRTNVSFASGRAEHEDHIGKQQ